MPSTTSHRSLGVSACCLFVLSLLSCVCVSRCSVTVTDIYGHSFTFDQSTGASSFPQFAIPAFTAVNFTVSASSDVQYLDIHVAIPGLTVANSTYNYVALLNGTNTLPFGTDTVTPADFVDGTTVFFTVGWQSGAAAVDTPALFLFSGSVVGEPPGSGNAVGDPMFQGFLGQSYQVHGVANQVYSLISDALVQVNAVFVFLTEGRCPSAALQLPFKTACWSHPGSYLGRLTLQTLADDRIDIVAGPADGGFARVLANGRELQLGEEWKGNDVSGVDHPHAHHLSRAHCTLLHSHVVQCHVGLYQLTVTNSDGFVNLHEVSVADWTALTHEVRSHGLLGQTWRRRVGGEVAGVDGLVDDYAEQDNDVFGLKTQFNQHRRTSRQ